MSDAHDTNPSCGGGIAHQGAIVETIGAMFEGIGQTLELHRKLLVREDPSSREEDVVYEELATRILRIAGDVTETAARMKAQRGLAMGAHDESAWGEEHVRAFEKVVSAQSRLLELLGAEVEGNAQMIAAMKSSQ